MFSPSNMLIKYLNAQPRDMYDIVGALEGYINADPKFQTNDFSNAINYVLKNGVSRNELFQEFDDSIEFEEDESKWNYEYYSLARVYLKDNFCEKRINHVIAVARKLYPTTIPIATKPQENVQVSKPEKIATGTISQQGGGYKSTGKKTQDQLDRNVSRTTPIPLSVKIGGLILLGVVLVLLIVFIMNIK